MKSSGKLLEGGRLRCWKREISRKAQGQTHWKRKPQNAPYSWQWVKTDAQRMTWGFCTKDFGIERREGRGTSFQVLFYLHPRCFITRSQTLEIKFQLHDLLKSKEMCWSRERQRSQVHWAQESPRLSALTMIPEVCMRGLSKPSAIYGNAYMEWSTENTASLIDREDVWTLISDVFHRQVKGKQECLGTVSTSLVLKFFRVRVITILIKWWMNGQKNGSYI